MDKVSEERALIITMIEEMIGDLDALDEKSGREAAEFIVSNIRAGSHRIEDKWVSEQ